MADELLNEFKNNANKLELIPSTGGVFEVSVDGQNIFSKKETGRFPEKGEVLNIVKEKDQ
ncbi:SelT/SelW/selH family protein [Bacillus sp. FJAT-27225]|nr:SelT/SelW/selH family protein [Bacillus sp. FJAT-27225]